MPVVHEKGKGFPGKGGEGDRVHKRSEKWTRFARLTHFLTVFGFVSECPVGGVKCRIGERSSQTQSVAFFPVLVLFGVNHVWKLAET